MEGKRQTASHRVVPAHPIGCLCRSSNLKMAVGHDSEFAPIQPLCGGISSDTDTLRDFEISSYMLNFSHVRSEDEAICTQDAVR